MSVEKVELFLAAHAPDVKCNGSQSKSRRLAISAYFGSH